MATVMVTDRQTAYSTVSVNLTLETIHTSSLQAWAVCGVARQSSALSTGVAFSQTSRDDCPQATPVDNLDDACLAATLQPTHALTTLVLSPKCD